MKKILVVGAGFLQDFVIRKAVQMGYKTLAVDSDSNAVGFLHTHKHATIDITDEKVCCEYAQEENVDGVITAATDFGVLTTAYIAERMGLPGLKYETAKLIKNKYQVKKRLVEQGADDSGWVYEIDSQSDILTLAGRLNYPVMVKPCDGSGSRGVGKVECYEELPCICRMAMESSRTQKAMLEPFITGEEYGAESFVENGNIHVLAVMKKWMTAPPYYAELGHAVPSGLNSELECKVKAYVKKTISVLGIDFGAVNMDLLITPDEKIHVVDIGVRMGGNLIGSHIVPFSTGIDYMGNLIKQAVGDTIDLQPKYSGKPIATKLLALRPGKVEVLPDIAGIVDECKVEILHHMRVGDRINEYHTNLDGYGYIIATAERLSDAIEHAESAKKKFDMGVVRKNER